MDYPGKVITKTQVTPTQTSASGNWTLDDQAAAIKNNNWPVALVPNPISKSLRFNSADSAYLNRTPATASNRKTWTWSGWVKRSALGTDQAIFSTNAGAGNDNYFMAYLNTVDKVTIYDIASGSYRLLLDTTQVFRDVGGWYHFVMTADTTQSTSSNRFKFYVNGVQVTAFGTATYPSQNLDMFVNSTNAHYVNANFTSVARLFYNGYTTEINFVDGQALTPSSFGMTNPQTGQWIPLKYSGTYGTNGFYLNFKDATSTTTLGYDYSGNANNWTTNNFSVTAGAGNDSLTDVPTPWFAYNTTGDVGGVIRGNYCTLNPLGGSINTIQDGNLQLTGTAASTSQRVGTMAVSSGKWYYEVTLTTLPVTMDPVIGFSEVNNASLFSQYPGQWSTSYAIYTLSTNTYLQKVNSAVFTNTNTTVAAQGDVIGVALDLDNGKIWFSKNGTFVDSGNPASGTNAQYTGITGTYAPAVRGTGGATTTTITTNFGQRPFAYTPPTGFRSLCTTNLPATAIGFGLTNQGDDYFNAVAFTSVNGSSSVTVGFEPDFTWVKDRQAAIDHYLHDVNRGYGTYLISNSTAAEASGGGVTARTSTGFNYTIGNANNWISWNWKAGGTGVTNTAGTITSTVSANTTAGFSIVTYTGTGANATVGHGLGVAPSMLIVKSRSGARSWMVYHASIGNTGCLFLDLTNATNTASFLWNNTSPTSSVFTIGTASTGNTVSENYVAYCFAAIPGYSAFGSYTGNGSTDGPFVFCNFRPRYVMYKRTDTTGNWIVYDTARNTYNLTDTRLSPNLADAEVAASTSRSMDILSNGFKLRGASVDTNASAGTYIYAAFAESPFQFSNAR